MPKMLHPLNLAGFGMRAWDAASHDAEKPFAYASDSIPVFDRNLKGLADNGDLARFAEMKPLLAPHVKPELAAAHYCFDFGCYPTDPEHFIPGHLSYYSLWYTAGRDYGMHAARAEGVDAGDELARLGVPGGRAMLAVAAPGSRMRRRAADSRDSRK